MKPDWKDAPDWAKFLAQDGDGTWWWYEADPEPSEKGNWNNSYGTKCERAYCYGPVEARP